MGGLSRKVSVNNIVVPFPASSQSERSLALKDVLLDPSLYAMDENEDEDSCESPGKSQAPPSPDFETASFQGFDEVDCRTCTVAFSGPSAGLLGIGRLEIRQSPGSSIRSQNPGGRRQLDGQRFSEALQRALSFEVDFVLVLDFQACPPGLEFANVFADFCREAGEAWRRRLRAAALLIKDNMFFSASQLPIAGLLAACPMCCPFVLCHGEAAAADFFRTGLGKGAGADLDSPFVALAHAQDGPSRQLAPSAKDGGQEEFAPSCLVTLVPMSQQDPSFSQVHTFHMLPNGDVRVIQSPPKDMVFQAEQSGGACAASTTSDKAVQTWPSEVGTCASLDAETRALGAVRFECSKEQLRQLVGAHVHIGELVVDAEAASRSAVGLPLVPLSAINIPKGSTTCCGSVNMFLRRLVQHMQGGAPKR